MTTIHFDNIGFYQTKLSEQELTFIKKEINDIQNTFNTALPITMNTSLAGNIAREYELSSECKSNITSILLPYLKLYVDNNQSLPDKIEYSLTNAWVNFQKKHEFNPVHVHYQALSFVIWIKIPYTIENEHNINSVKYSNTPLSGSFSFLYTDSLGCISQHIIKADIKYENTLLIFPAKLNHCVYPFYTSDEYRISISGNFK